MNSLPVWLVDEGTAGHRVQSEGVLRAMGLAGFAMDIRYIPCEPALRGFLRPAARAVFSQLGPRAAMAFARKVARFSVPDQDGAPAFIISSAGRSAFVSRALALHKGVPNVFVGNPKPFPASWFKVIMSPVPLKNAPGAIITNVVPNNVTPAICREHASQYWNGAIPQDCWTLFIGGTNRNHRFTESDWRGIARGVNELAQRHGVKWLISTSRRTGEDVERVLSEHILPEAVKELVLFSRDPKAVVSPFMGSGKRIFVTQDSLTMLSEAICSGRDVVSLMPEHIDLAPDNFMTKVQQHFRSSPFFTPIRCAAMEDYQPRATGDDLNDWAAASMANAAGELRERLSL